MYKRQAYSIFYDSLEIVGKKMKDADKSPLEVWKQALENITPQVEVKSKRIGDRKSTRLNSSHSAKSRMPSSA